MKEIIGTGKNLDLATNDGLLKLNASREEVAVEPLDQGKKGFLGIGRKLAKVRVTVRPDIRIRTQVLLRNILGKMDIETDVKIEEDGDNLNIVLGEEASILIGHRGQTLDALQYFIARYLNEDKDEWRKVVLDIDNYRDRREENLRSMAERMAEQVIRNKRDIRTEPLTAPERRIIHMALKENSEITTFSIGDGARKRVVITLSDRSARRPSSRDTGRGGYGGRSNYGNRGGAGGRGGSGNRSGSGGRGGSSSRGGSSGRSGSSNRSNSGGRSSSGDRNASSEKGSPSGREGYSGSQRGGRRRSSGQRQRQPENKE